MPQGPAAFPAVTYLPYRLRYSAGEKPEAFRNRSRRLEKGGGFQGAQKTGKKTIDQFAALVAFQLASLLQLPVQIQPQKDGKAVRRKRKAGAEGFPDSPEEGEGSISLKMNIKIFPAVIRFILRKKISAVFRNSRKEGRSGAEIFRPAFPDKGAVALQRVLEQIAAVVPVRVIKIIGFLLPGFQTEIQKDERLILHGAGRQKAEAAKLILSQNITLPCHFFILEAISEEYYNQDKQGTQPRRTLTGASVKNIPGEWLAILSRVQYAARTRVRAERRRK